MFAHSQRHSNEAVSHDAASTSHEPVAHEPVAHEPTNARPRESALGGTAQTFAAEMLVVPSGLFVAALLSRRLSLEEYGVWTLAITFVTWLQWSLSSLFARSAIKIVSEAVSDAVSDADNQHDSKYDDDHSAVQDIAATVLRTYAATSILAALVLTASAEVIASLLHEPRLVLPLRLLALDVPLFCLAQAHRNILIGLGRFKDRALASAVRWIARAALIAFFVFAGLGLEGAIIGSMGASLCELWTCRRAAPLSVQRSSFPARALWKMALPLLCCALILRLFDKLDLFLLSSSGASSSTVAFYGAAQNLALAPGIFALAFAPTLLASVARARREGDLLRAQDQSRNALRAVVLLSPLAALVSATSQPIVELFFGARFAPAAPILALLMWAATALAMVSVCNALLMAFDRTSWALGLLVPLVTLAPLAHSVLISTYGASGAAGVTLFFALFCALLNMFIIHKLGDASVPLFTWLRAAFISGLVYFCASNTGGEGWWLVPKLIVFMVLIMVLFGILGEWHSHEKARFHAIAHAGRKLLSRKHRFESRVPL